MTRKYERTARLFFSTPLALYPPKIHEIAAALEFQMGGGKLSAEDIEAKIDRVTTRRVARQSGAVAVLPVVGIISQRMPLFMDVSGGGGASTERIGQQFRALVEDESVKAIVLDIDSPGGGVYGVQELFDEIFAARGRKPIIAVANSLAASAAYYLASAADEVVVTPSGEVGSIGIYTVHAESSVMDEAIGVNFTIISAGKFKTEVNEHEPLSSEAHDALQTRVDEYYSLFVNAVAKGRGVRASEVRNGFAEGRLVGAQEAVRVGLADRVATLGQVLRDYGVEPPRMAMAGAGAEPRAEDDEPEIGTISIRQDKTDDGAKFYALDEWPQRIKVTKPAVLAQIGYTIFVVDGDDILFDMANGSATYRRISEDCDDNWLCDLVTSKWDPAPDEQRDEDDLKIALTPEQVDMRRKELALTELS